MLSFRKKIIISYLVVFLLFIALMFPFSVTTVKSIIHQSIVAQSNELITKIRSAPNNDELVRRLKELRSTLFFRVALITNDQKVLYDTHLKRILGPKFSQEYIVDHPEVSDAFKEGVGFSEGYSNLFSQKFAYVAVAFDFHGKTYVMRSAFPYRFVTALTHNFEVGFLAVSSIVLALFSLMTWLIINHLSSPIRKILVDIAPYQEGKTTTVPEIRLRSVSPLDDFGKLAATLNSLSLRIRNQINTLTRERNEKEAILHAMLEMRQNFIANASHELKTPLTVIRGFAETLHDHPDLPQEIVLDVTAKIVNNCKKMTSLIKDLLILSDIENMTETNLIECDLEDLIFTCQEHVLEAHSKAQIEVENLANEPVYCTADPRLLTMAFNNVLENAVKYSKEPAKVHVTIDRSDEKVMVAIRDEGIGIPPAHLENIFQRFYSVDREHSHKMGG